MSYDWYEMWNFVLIFSVLYLNLNFRFRFNIFFKWEITWSRKKYKTEAYTYKVNPHFLILTIMSFDRPKWLKFASSHFLPLIRNQSATTTKCVIICLPQPVYDYFLYFQSTKHYIVDWFLLSLNLKRQMLSPNMSCLMSINTARCMMDLSSGRVSF